METETKAKPVLVSPMARYVRPEVFEAITGYTVKAQQRKRQEGVWTEGNEFVKAPDGLILMDLEGYNRWAVSALRFGRGR